MRLMRKHDPQAREDGFHGLLPFAAEHVTELIDEFNAERDDHGLRCWLLELIGAARSPQAFDLLAEQLHSTDESLSSLAARGLAQLDTQDARQLLWEWRQHQNQR